MAGLTATLLAAGAVASAAGAGASVYQGSKARKDAKKATAANKKQSSLENLMSVAGGQGISRATPEKALPVVDYGGALQRLGSVASSYGQQKIANQQAADAQAFKELQHQDSQNMKQLLYELAAAKNPSEINKNNALAERYRKGTSTGGVLDWRELHPEKTATMDAAGTNPGSLFMLR